MKASQFSDAQKAFILQQGDEGVTVAALRQIHADPGAGLSVQGLAAAAGMSRSTFFDRFHTEVGSAPLEYVAAWRMAVAKDMLLRGNIAMAELAKRVGYGSVSAFSMAFSRHMGIAE
jgi:AraC-like DNA-binding protein